MNLTPNDMKKSVVTEKKNLVIVGTSLYTSGSEFVKVIERDGDQVLVNAEDDTSHDFDEWFDLNNLQVGWQFARQDNWLNQAELQKC